MSHHVIPLRVYYLIFATLILMTLNATTTHAQRARASALLFVSGASSFFDDIYDLGPPNSAPVL